MVTRCDQRDLLHCGYHNIGWYTVARSKLLLALQSSTAAAVQCWASPAWVHSGTPLPRSVKSVEKSSTPTLEPNALWFSKVATAAGPNMQWIEVASLDFDSSPLPVFTLTPTGATMLIASSQPVLATRWSRQAGVTKVVGPPLMVCHDLSQRAGYGAMTVRSLWMAWNGSDSWVGFVNQ